MLFGAMAIGYTNLEVRIAKLEEGRRYNSERIDVLTDQVKASQVETKTLIETVRKENREDHKFINEQIERIKGK